MPLGEAMQTQRAIRRLKTDPVEDDLVVQLIELASKAPTGSNAQNWEFVVVRDPAAKHRLARLNRQLWQVYARFVRPLTRPRAGRDQILRAVEWQADHLQEAPVIVVACLRGFRFPFPHILVASYYGSIFPAVQNLLLAARAAGLGAALLTIPLWNLPALRRILGLPRRVTPCAVIPLGWPRGRYGPTTRKPVQEIVSFDRFGRRLPVRTETSGTPHTMAG
jgi:nitroreductase